MFDWNTADAADKVSYLGLKIAIQSVKLQTLESYASGTQPLQYIPPELADELQGRLDTLNCNYCGLLVDNLTQRVTVTGFRVGDAETTDPRLWSVWRANNLVAESKWLIRDFLALGRAYALAWKDENGNVAVTVESPKECTVFRDPVSRRVLGGLKQWSAVDSVTGADQSWSVLYEPDHVTTFASTSPASVNSIPNTAWRVVSRQPNPLGEVPLVEFTNRTNTLDFYGTSEFANIMNLQDGLNKVLLDSMVTSEYYSAPRRWITGFAVPESALDQDGEPMQVLGRGRGEVLALENEEAAIGQFAGTALSGYDTLTKIFVQQISAISGLPEYMVGTSSTNPTSAEAIDASDAVLTQKVAAKIDLITPGLADLGRLILALTDGRRGVSNLRVDPIFADLQVRNVAAQSDSYVKLVSAGVPPRLAAKQVLGWSDDAANQLSNEPVTTGNSNDRAAA